MKSAQPFDSYQNARILSGGTLGNPLSSNKRELSLHFHEIRTQSPRGVLSKCGGERAKTPPSSSVSHKEAFLERCGKPTLDSSCTAWRMVIIFLSLCATQMASQRDIIQDSLKGKKGGEELFGRKV